jgi:hypothetical protein
MPPMSWSRQLSKTISLRDGSELRTLLDAAEALVGLSEERQRHAWVEHAAELIMTAAESEEREEIKAATSQLERALKREGLMR